MKILSIIVMCVFVFGCEVSPIRQPGTDTSTDLSEKDTTTDSSTADFGLDVEISTDTSASDSGSDTGKVIDMGLCPSVGTASVFLIGDSTVAPNSGWGDAFDVLFNNEITVINRAIGGRSSKSFYDEGSFDTTRDEIKDGDFVMIQFGHNDSKAEEYRRTEPGTAPDFDDTFREYIEKYINEIREKGGVPIFLTPVSRMTFGGGTHARSHGDYPAAGKKIALDNNVVMLDLEQHSHDIFDALGDEQTMALYSDGEDRTHFPPDKAFRVAEFVETLLRESDSDLRCALLPAD